MLPPSVRIFLCTVPQDMRRSFDTLAMVVRQLTDKDPQDGSLYVFVGRRPRRVKVLLRAGPVVDDFFAWYEAVWPRLLEETPMHNAVGNARNQQAALRRFLEDGRLPIHNNFSERQLRREALGRKNWLFIVSERPER